MSLVMFYMESLCPFGLYGKLSIRTSCFSCWALLFFKDTQFKQFWVDNLLIVNISRKQSRKIYLEAFPIKKKKKRYTWKQMGPENITEEARILGWQICSQWNQPYPKTSHLAIFSFSKLKFLVSLQVIEPFFLCWTSRKHGGFMPISINVCLCGELWISPL